jgi:hypothetical protein
LPGKYMPMGYAAKGSNTTATVMFSIVPMG